MLTTSRYNALDYLGSAEDIAAYLKAAKAENDAAYFLQAASNALQARGILQLAQETGLEYRTLCRMFFADGAGRGPAVPPDALERVALALVPA